MAFTPTSVIRKMHSDRVSEKEKQAKESDEDVGGQLHTILRFYAPVITLHLPPIQPPLTGAVPNPSFALSTAFFLDVDMKTILIDWSDYTNRLTWLWLSFYLMPGLMDGRWVIQYRELNSGGFSCESFVVQSVCQRFCNDAVVAPETDFQSISH